LDHLAEPAQRLPDAGQVGNQPGCALPCDFFRIDDGLIAEHWESVDWVRVYQSFGLLSDEVKDG
jgi:hypothetical protein